MVMRSIRIEHIRRVWLNLYAIYCRLLYPFYKRLTIDSLDLIIISQDIMPPLSSSENLLFGDIRGKTILDVGTGCGIIALVAKKLGAGYVLGVDISEEAISNAETNLKNNFLDSRGIEFRVGDLYQNVTRHFDIIVSAPPYFKDLPRVPRDYKYCGGDILNRILRDGKHYLSANGEIRVLHPVSSKRYIMALAETYGYTLTSVDHVHKKDNRWLRILLGQTVRPRLGIFIFKLD
jgi:methylase of polypeptide subunit release factors